MLEICLAYTYYDVKCTYYPNSFFQKLWTNIAMVCFEVNLLHDLPHIYCGYDMILYFKLFYF